MRGNALHARRSLIHLHLVGILAVPVGGDAEADRPVCRLVENRSVLVVPELVAVVFEDLAEIVELGPSLMAGGAGKSILTCETRNRASVIRVKDQAPRAASWRRPRTLRMCILSPERSIGK